MHLTFATFVHLSLILSSDSILELTTTHRVCVCVIGGEQTTKKRKAKAVQSGASAEVVAAIGPQVPHSPPAGMSAGWTNRDPSGSAGMTYRDLSGPK